MNLDQKKFLIDSNVWIDIFTADPKWASWSEEQLKIASQFEICINPIIFSEISIPFDSIKEILAILEKFNCKILPLPIEAGFLAGKAFLNYRKKSQTKSSPLPDFYIGAHAEFSDLTLITRDNSRYKTYFPKLRIISPTKT